MQRQSSGKDSTNPSPLLSIDRLVRYFKVRRSGVLFGPDILVKAVDDISFSVAPGETLGVVGESGCGKSTIAKLIMNIDTPTSGTITFDRKIISSLPETEKRRLSLRIQYVFQDPLGALDPRMKVIDQVAEPFTIHQLHSVSERRERAEAVMRTLDLKDFTYQRYPHELSGGQRQRVLLARALVLEPEMLVCDEPISAIDVSLQAQVVNLLVDLRRRLGLTLIFISHDMSVVRHLCDRVAVMYLGKIVELAPCDELFDAPAHPYTQAMLSAIPIPQPGLKRNRILLKGDPPSPIDLPPGCRFHRRCHQSLALCAESEPEFKRYHSEHWGACHIISDTADSKEPTAS
jgi:oligopeptide/dipeptide ABC transporter ATP-binding protein